MGTKNMAKSNWDKSWGTYDLALQCAAMVIFNIDEATEDEQYSNGELFDLVSAFNDRLDTTKDAEAIKTLNVYAQLQWHHVDIPGNLTNPHLNVIAGVVHGWIERHDS